VAPSAVDWFRDMQPRAEALCFKLRSDSYEELSARELAQSLDSLIADAIQVFGLTMQNDPGQIESVTRYFAFLEDELGERGTLLGATLLQGLPNDSGSSGKALAELANVAAATPAVRDALIAEAYEPNRVPGSAPFQDALESFLGEYGWRAESWGLSHVPVWADDPTPVLRFVARDLRNQHLSSGSMPSAQEKSKQALAEVESQISPDKRETFAQLLRRVEKFAAVGESRARWQLTAAGVLRVPIITLGRKLVGAGVLDEPNDVFYLYIHEVRDVASEPRPMQQLVAERKADFRRWETLEAPAFVGRPGSGPAPNNPVMQAAFRLILGVGAPASVEGNVIKGTAASKGKVRGVAKVIGSMAEADRFEPGNILVCQTSSPSWVPLFAIAGGVVADTGGILTHSAVCAREYAIPCVVGAQRATQLIPDGAIVTVDGDLGTVTIE
jgi:pyruvate,water dikinase